MATFIQRKSLSYFYNVYKLISKLRNIQSLWFYFLYTAFIILILNLSFFYSVALKNALAVMTITINNNWN